MMRKCYKTEPQTKIIKETLLTLSQYNSSLYRFTDTMKIVTQRVPPISATFFDIF